MPSMPKDLSVYLPPVIGTALKGAAAMVPMGCAAPDVYAPTGPTPEDIIWKKGQEACLMVGMETFPIKVEEDVQRKRLAAIVTRLDNGQRMSVPTEDIMDCSDGSTPLDDVVDTAVTGKKRR